MIQNKNLAKNVNILFFMEDQLFANLIKCYLEEYEFDILIKSEFSEIFDTLINKHIDLLVLPVLCDYYDIVNFYEQFDKLKNKIINNNLKILFVSFILPNEDFFKFLEMKQGYFMMQYSLPNKWAEKIKAIL